MVLTNIEVTSLNEKIVEGILTLIPKAEQFIMEKNFSKFIEITETIRTCSEQTYTSLQNELSDNIFDISWDLALAENDPQEKVIDLAKNWSNKMTIACKRHLV